MLTIVGRATVHPDAIITASLPRPSDRSYRRLFRAVEHGGVYRLAESPQGERDFAAVRKAGLSSVTVEIVRSPAYNAGIFTWNIPRSCRPARLKVGPARPGSLPREWDAECL